MNAPAFDEQHVLHALKHYLPTQTPLKDFIHHNSLHAFQKLNFYDAIFKSSGIFGHQATLSLNDYRKLYSLGRIRAEIIVETIKVRKGAAAVADWESKMLLNRYDSNLNPRAGRLRAYWKNACHVDLDNLVHPLLFRILCSYLDQGIALTHFPYENEGLLSAIRQLERHSYTSFFSSSRAKALLFDPNTSIASLLALIVGNEAYYEQYLFDQQFAHRGWSGIASAIEDNPHSVLYPKKIALKELVLLELLLEVDRLDRSLGKSWKPLCTFVKEDPLDLFETQPLSEFQEVLLLWQDAFEWSYYDQVLSGVKHLLSSRSNGAHQQKSFQAVFCIDERECSLRRHLEMVDPDCETLGSPGFFGVEFFFQPQHGKFYEKLCPAPVTPGHLIKEYEVNDERKHEIWYTKDSHTFIKGFLISLSLGLVAAGKLFLDIFRPKMSPAISNAFAHMNVAGKLTIENKSPEDMENGLQIGFTVEEMAVRVEALLRGMGMIKYFTPLVYIVAHGSSSANNPHHGAHDCGACSGRPGAVNSRVFAFMANHKGVRAILDSKGIAIPNTTQFIGAMHDTASDEIAFYDEYMLTGANKDMHEHNKQYFEAALDHNAKERSRRFASIDTRSELHKVREAIRRRSVSYFEPRPELGHGTNALCFVGNRSLTKGLFLDRRAFMNSYDYRTDPDGKVLLNVIKPLPPVCGGINLEYYFSRVDNQRLGAGTKLPHNVMGLIGVANSSDGDLRPGLPLQMIEVHDPIRLLIIVEHYPEVVLNTIKSLPELYEWFINDWVHLVAINPDTNTFHRFHRGEFKPYLPLEDDIKFTDDVNRLIELAKEMETNHILHATQENLPVHVVKA